MNIEIRKLTPELASDYVEFFDTTPHATGKEEHKCYCIWWCNDDLEGKDFSTVEKRRKIALQYINGNNIQGYLAYYNSKVVGWCNANTKAECLKCYCWNVFVKMLGKMDLIMWRHIPIRNSLIRKWTLWDRLECTPKSDLNYLMRQKRNL